MRVGELTLSQHVVKVKDIQVGVNKDKILLVSYSSKTHGKESLPQKIKIEATKRNHNRFFCPFELTRAYLKSRGGYADDSEQFFIFKGKIPVKPWQAGKVMRMALDRLGLDSSLYDFHSYRGGRAGDLMKMQFSILDIKSAGRWSSNAVYKNLSNKIFTNK